MERSHERATLPESEFENVENRDLARFYERVEMSVRRIVDRLNQLRVLREEYERDGDTVATTTVQERIDDLIEQLDLIQAGLTLAGHLRSEGPLPQVRQLVDNLQAELANLQPVPATSESLEPIPELEELPFQLRPEHVVDVVRAEFKVTMPLKHSQKKELARRVAVSLIVKLFEIHYRDYDQLPALFGLKKQATLLKFNDDIHALGNMRRLEPALDRHVMAIESRLTNFTQADLDQVHEALREIDE